MVQEEKSSVVMICFGDLIDWSDPEDYKIGDFRIPKNVFERPASDRNFILREGCSLDTAPKCDADRRPYVTLRVASPESPAREFSIRTEFIERICISTTITFPTA